MITEQNCNTCAKQNTCPKSGNIENYHFSDGCIEFQSKNKPDNFCGGCPIWLAADDNTLAIEAFEEHCSKCPYINKKGE